MVELTRRRMIASSPLTCLLFLNATNAKAAPLEAANRTTEAAASWQHPGRLRGFAFAPDDSIVVGSGEAIVFYDINTGEPRKKVPKLKIMAATTALAFAKSGELAVATDDGRVRFFDPKSGAARGELEVSDKAVRSLIYSHGDDHVITGDETGRISVWNIAKLQRVATAQEHTWPVVMLSVSPDGRTLISAGQGYHEGSRLPDSDPVIWELAGLKKKHTIKDTPILYVAATFWPDAETVVLSGGYRKEGAIQSEAHLLSVKDGKLLQALTPGEAKLDSGVTGGVGFDAVALSDGRLVTSGVGGATLWSSKREPQHTFDDRTAWATPRVIASADNSWLATYSHTLAKGADREKDESYSTTIQLWKLPKTGT
jgi:WD40 repeat protein